MYVEPSFQMNLPQFSSLPIPTPAPPPPPPPPAAPVGASDWANVTSFHEYLSAQQMERCTRCDERWFEMALDTEGVCHRCGLRDAPKKRRAGEPFLISKENHTDPGAVPNCLSDLTQMEEMAIAKAHCHMITKRFWGHQYHYTGHCVCFWQSTITFRDALPVLPSETDVILLRPKNVSIQNKRASITNSRMNSACAAGTLSAHCGG
jgi:hypothetical protein